MVAGLQVPVILLFDVAGNVGAVAFWHRGAICVKVGDIPVLMVISIVAVVAQPDDGVKV